MLVASNLPTPGRIRHGFFTRRGGVSEAPFEGLNCGYGSDDDRDAVSENRRLALARLGAADMPLVTAYQVHSADAVFVDSPWSPDKAPKVDALVTSRPGLVLGILTADCAPVLFVDAHAGVIGAAHAGWRGAHAGVLEKCVEAMVTAGASAGNICAAVGPCIGQPSYEVGPEFRARFVEDDPNSDKYFMPSPKTGHALFDLGAYVMARLGTLGLASSEFLGQDTCADSDRFYSYRRGTLAGQPDYGRLLSAIVIVED
jgi:polyphenol oxidase